MSDSMQPATSGGHGLMCPTCSIQLMMSDRQGIEIDFCPKCRGVWLDRGELDKIIERSLPATGAPAVDNRPQPQDSYGHGGGHGKGHGGGSDKHGYGRRESFLSRLFD